MYGRQFIRLSDIIAASAGTPGPAGPQGIQGPAGGLTPSDLVAIATQFDRLRNRFCDGVALAGAINVLPPEAGRHINISVGGAGYQGAGAASIAVSARLGIDTIAYVGVARGPTQTLANGGLGWSPW